MGVKSRQIGTRRSTRIAKPAQNKWEIQSRTSSPISLTDLPRELLAQIVSHLDKPSAISLALVARCFTPFAEPRVWSSLRLSLNPHFGEMVLIQPFERTLEPSYLHWAKEEAKAAEMRHGIGMNTLAKGILVNGGARKLGMVRAMDVTCRPGAITSLMTLLDVVSPHLISLTFTAPSFHVYHYLWRPHRSNTLDYHIQRPGLVFPTLTHLTINRHALKTVNTLIHLCRLSPNLVSLEANLNHRMPLFGSTLSAEDDTPLPSINEKLSFMQITFNDLHDGTESEESEDDDSEADHPIIDLIRASPNLLRLSVIYQGDRGQIVQALSETVGALPRLESLYFNAEPEEFCAYIPAVEPGYPVLKELILISSYPPETFMLSPPLPNLEILMTICPSRPYNTSREYHEEHFDRNSSLVHSLASSLRSAPLLRHNHISKLHYTQSTDPFDELELVKSNKTFSGFVRSYRHGNDEILFTRQLSHYIEVSDNLPDPDFYLSDKELRRRYTGLDGIDRDKRFEYRENPIWVIHTDLAGVSVPFELIEEMRIAQGATMEEWDGRNVEVTDVAWSVVEAWKLDQAGKEAS